VVALVVLVLALLGLLIGNGTIDVAPEHHADGHGPLASLGGTGSGFYPKVAPYVVTAGIRLCLMSGAQPAVLDGSIGPTSSVQGGLRFLGAYVRHSNATKGCKGWPLCNGAAIPNLEGTTATAFAHRLAAGLLIVGLLVLVMWASKFERQRPDVYFASVAALVMAILQALAGAAVVWTNLDLFTALAHAALVGLMFAALAYVGVHVLPRSYASERAQARSLRSAAEATAPSP